MLDAVPWPHARSYFSWEVNSGLTGTILAGLTGTVPVSPDVSQLAPVVIEHCVPLNPCGYCHVTKIYVCLTQLIFVMPTLDYKYVLGMDTMWLLHIWPRVHRRSAVIFCIILLQFKPSCLKGI